MSKSILLFAFISCCNFFLLISSPLSLHSQNLKFGTKLKLKTKKYFTKLTEHSPIICDVVSTATKSFVRTAAFRIPINLVRTAVEQPPRLSDEEDCVEWLTEGVERGIRDGKCAAVKDVRYHIPCDCLIWTEWHVFQGHSSSVAQFKKERRRFQSFGFSGCVWLLCNVSSKSKQRSK